MQVKGNWCMQVKGKREEYGARAVYRGLYQRKSEIKFEDDVIARRVFIDL